MKYIMNKVRINSRIENFKYNALGMIDTILWALDGKFGRKVLKPKYRRIWRCITWGSLAVLFFIYVLIPLFEFWHRVVIAINYVYWGI